MTNFHKCINFPQSCPHQDLLSRNVLGLAMLMFLPQRQYHHNLRSTDGLTVLARLEIVAILVHYQPSYNTSNTMKPSEPLLLADVNLHCGMYPAGKVDISQHLAIPGFPQSDHTVGKPSADAGSLCSEA
jgi:hypothetical protein